MKKETSTAVQSRLRGESFDTHVQQYRYLFEGLLMRTTLFYCNTYRLAGNYRPAVCREYLKRMGHNV